MAWIVYILQCADKSLYTGITNDLRSRISAHESGRGAKYTKGRGPFTLVHQEEHATRSAATKREAQIKTLSRERKAQLCLSSRD
ncbi:MAG: GIY-YIG nuclease family protein [Alphaproteobacteria bacterium]|nr:GIY-YIG nuclease family protein [Alphaproteobacteria bacterium]